MTNGGQSARFGSHLSRLHSTYRFGLVLFLVIGQFVFTAFAPNRPWTLGAMVLLQSITLAMSLWTSGLTRHTRTLTSTVLGIGIAGAIVQSVLQSRLAEGAAGLVVVVLCFATTVVIAVGVFEQSGVNRQSVRGAICVYLLLGLTYAYLYGAIAALDPGPFFAQQTDGTRSLRLYFSFVTMTTVGYGDYAAATDLGRTMAVTEALIGQLYLVTVVAGLVSQFRPMRTKAE